jgi:serine protease Do
MLCALYLPASVSRARRRVAFAPVGIAILLGAACSHPKSVPMGRVPSHIVVAPDVVEPLPSPTQGAPDVIGVHELERAFEGAALTIAPSVVSIVSERAVDQGEVPAFLRPFGPPDGTIRGLGSGVILDAKGYILTNNHVVEGASLLRVRLHDEREFNAEVVGTDPKTDLAVVRIEATGLVAAMTASSEQVRVGQWVMAAGSPFGLAKSVSAGIVSALGRGGMGIADYGDFIQTDAAINQGNSGGPLIDLRGRVIGVNTAIASQTGGSNGVGFAIPSDIARVVMAQLIDHGSVERGWLGIVMGRLTPALSETFGYSGSDGVLVDDVDPKGPAAAAGIRAGDIVTELDGKPLRDMVALRNRVAQRRPGTKVKVTLVRAGASREFELVLGSLPGQAEGKSRRRPAEPKPKPAVTHDHGLQLADPTDALRARWNIDVRKGAVVTDVAPRSVAAREVQPGDLLMEVGDQAVQSAAQARTLLDKAELGRGIRLRVARGGAGHYVLLRRDP